MMRRWLLIVAIALAGGCFNKKPSTTGTNVGTGSDEPDRAPTGPKGLVP